MGRLTGTVTPTPVTQLKSVASPSQLKSVASPSQLKSVASPIIIIVSINLLYMASPIAH